FAFGEAAEHYRVLLDLPASVTGLDRTDLREKLADACSGSGDPASALELYEQLARETPEAPPLQRARWLRKAGTCHNELGQLVEAHECLLRGLSRLGVRPGGGLSVAYKLLAVLVPTLGTLTYPRDRDRAREIQALCLRLVHVQFFLRPPGWVMQALDFTLHQLLATMAVGEYDPSPQTRFTLGHLCLHGPRLFRPLAPGFLRRAARLADRLEDTPVKALVLRQTGYLLHESGLPREASLVAHRAEALSDRLGDVLGLAETYLILGTIYAYWGRLERAEHYSRKALETSQSCGSRTTEALAVSDLAHAAYLRGDPVSARRWFEDLQSRQAAPFLCMITELVRAWIQLLEGQPAAALETVEANARRCEELGGGPFYARLLRHQKASALLARAEAGDDRETSLGAAELCIRDMISDVFLLFVGRARALRARARLLRGDRAGALKDYREADALFERLDSPLEQGRVQLALAGLEADPAHRVRAGQLLGEAGVPPEDLQGASNWVRETLHEGSVG
ncbi:MAG: hypothetical protein AB1758_07200, partial [Candidatus Eremiobacterota bacterium]